MSPNSVRLFAPLQNIRVVSFNILGALLPPVPLKIFGSMSGMQQTLNALLFLGYRVAAYANTGQIKCQEIESLDVLLKVSGFADSFEKFFVSSLPPAKALAAFAGALDVSPVDVLHVGVDLDADVNAALVAGMRAAWLAPDAHFKPTGAVHLRTLHELPDLLRLADTVHLRRKGFSREVRNMIASLRGLPDETTDGTDASEKAIGPIILNFVAKLGAGNRPIAELRACWVDIVSNPKFLNNCTPESLSSQGVLSIHCTNSIVREELRWHEKRILSAIQRRYPGMGIKKLRVHV